MLRPVPSEDVDHILEHTESLWRELNGQHLFITGGTGFFGKWLLESIAAANDRLGAQARATILSRDPARFAAEVPHLAARPEFSWLIGDTADFAFPAGHFDYVFHFATASAAEVSAGGMPTIMHTLRGTERVLDLARAKGAKRLLFASSGAVYGPQPTDLTHLREDYRGSPDPNDPVSAYGEMKRLSEIMCITSGLDCVIARGFAFIGPYLPLTDKFAAGSFMRDALKGGPIVVRGNGSARRSYLYAADMAVWLLTMLVRGKPGRAYNAGSNEAVSTLQLAERIACCAHGPLKVEVQGTEKRSMSDSYVPDVSRAGRELGLRVAIDFEQAVERSINALTADAQSSVPAGKVPRRAST